MIKWVIASALEEKCRAPACLEGHKSLTKEVCFNAKELAEEELADFYVVPG